MSIESLVEDSIIADLQRDSLLASQTIRKHDYSLAIGGDDLPLDPEVTSIIVVSAIDRGEFKIGSGIRNIAVEILIRVNGDADNFTGALLDSLTEIVRSRLMPSPTVAGAISGRENVFSIGGIKIYGITNGEVTQRIDTAFERRRLVPATFIAAKIS